VLYLGFYIQGKVVLIELIHQTQRRQYILSAMVSAKYIKESCSFLLLMKPNNMLIQRDKSLLFKIKCIK
jgi:hypothetical protein